MDTLIRMKAEEINESLIDFLRTSFKGKKIALHIYEEEEINETEFILKDSVTEKQIFESIEDVKKGIGLKTYTIEELKHEFLNEPKP